MSGNLWQPREHWNFKWPMFKIVSLCGNPQRIEFKWYRVVFLFSLASYGYHKKASWHAIVVCYGMVVVTIPQSPCTTMTREDHCWAFSGRIYSTGLFRVKNLLVSMYHRTPKSRSHRQTSLAQLFPTCRLTKSIDCPRLERHHCYKQTENFKTP